MNKEYWISLENIENKKILSFMDQIFVFSKEGIKSVKFKYKKSMAILAFIASQPNKSIKRQVLAEMFWPLHDLTSAKSNLRVVVADILKCWREANLPPAIDCQRDFVKFQYSNDIIADVVLIESVIQISAVKHNDLIFNFILEISDKLWLADFDAHDLISFGNWVSKKREVFSSFFGVLSKKVDKEENACPLFFEKNKLFSEISYLSLLRIEVDSVHQALLGEKDGWIENYLGHIKNQVNAIGGEVVDFDDIGVTILCGRLNLRTGARWQTLRMAEFFAKALHSLVSFRMGAASGKLNVVNEDGKIKVQGLPVRLANRLALYANANELVCCDSFSDFLEISAHPLQGPVYFRGMEGEFWIHVVNFSSSDFILRMPAVNVSNQFFIDRQGLFHESIKKIESIGREHVLSVEFHANDGVGKTRLAWEISLQAQRSGCDIWWFQGCSEFRMSPWKGLRDAMFGQALGAGCTLIASDWHRLVTQNTHISKNDLETALSFFCGDKLFQESNFLIVEEVVFLLLVNRAKKAPQCIVVDDLDWMDGATVKLLNKIYKETASVFWIFTKKSNNSKSKIDFEIHGANHQAYQINPFDKESSIKFVEMFGVGLFDKANESKSRLLNCRGISLYLIEDFCPEGRKSHHFFEFCNALLNSMAVFKPVLQVAAVVGMVFNRDDILWMHESLGELGLEQALQLAINAGLLLNRGNGNFAFFHEKLRLHVISTIPFSRKKMIVEKFTLLLKSQARYVEAAVLCEEVKNNEMARGYWISAADNEIKKGHFSVACDFFYKAKMIGCVDKFELDRLRACLGYIRCLIVLHGYGSKLAHKFIFQIARNNFDLSRDLDLQFQIKVFYYLYISTYSNQKGMNYALKIMDNLPNDEAYHTVCWMMLNSLFWLKKNGQAKIWFHRLMGSGKNLSRSQRSRYLPIDPMVLGSYQMAWLAWRRANLELAKKTIEQTESLISDRSGKQERVLFHTMTGLSDWLCGGIERLPIQQALDIARVEEFQFFENWAEFLHLLMQSATLAEEATSKLKYQIHLLKKGCPGVSVVTDWLLTQAHGRER